MLAKSAQLFHSKGVLVPFCAYLTFNLDHSANAWAKFFRNEFTFETKERENEKTRWKD